MRYKLSFSKTHEGCLRITASVGRHSDHVIAIYQDEEAFLHLASHAGLSEAVMASLRGSVEIAFNGARTPACCEEVELSDAQLGILRLGSARSLASRAAAETSTTIPATT